MQKKGYNKKLDQKYSPSIPTGKKVTGLAVSFSMQTGDAVASWGIGSLKHVKGFEVQWFVQVQTTSGAKWENHGGTSTLAGSVRATSTSVPPEALAVRVSVKPVSTERKYQWQEHATKKDAKGNKYVQYTTKEKMVAYWKGAAAEARADAGGSVQPEAPSAPVLTAVPYAPTWPGAPRVAYYPDITFNCKYHANLANELYLYSDGAWGAHGEGKLLRREKTSKSGYYHTLREFQLADGHAYCLDAREVNTVTGTPSGWSAFSNVVEMPPLAPSNLAVKTLSSAAFEASWRKQGYTGDGYVLRWAQSAEGITLDEPPGGVNEAAITNGATSYSAAVSAGTWYFTARATGSLGNSAWVAPIRVVVGLVPAAPTLSELPSYAVVGGGIGIGWTYNNADGSSQSAYEVQYSVNGGAWASAGSGSTSASALDFATDGFSHGDVLKFRVRTRGAVDGYGPWAESPAVNMEEPPNVTLSVTNLSLPLAMTFSSSADVRQWHLVVISAEEHQATGDDGNQVVLPEGYVAYEGTLTYGEPDFDARTVAVELDLADAAVADGVRYRATLDAITAHGLTDSDTAEFTPDWDVDAPVPYAVIPDPGEDLVAHIFTTCTVNEPVVVDGEETWPERDDVTLSVYRIDADGTPIPIALDVPNAAGIEVVDPHPRFGESWYRIAARADDGSRGFADVPCTLKHASVVLQFDTTLTFYADGFDDMGFIELPYNLERSETFDPDAALVPFIGNPDPTLFTGTQLGRKADFSTSVIKSEDPEVISKIRMLGGSTRRAYYRDPDGLGFWAWVVPSLQHEGSKVASANFEVTRVMGDYEGSVGFGGA